MEDRNTDMIQVPYIVHEGTMARMERTIKRLFILVIIAILIIFMSNGIWVWYINQYEYCIETTSYEQDGEGINLIGDRNHVNTGSEVYQDEEGTEEKGR